jgi:hypothetical protein
MDTELKLSFTESFIDDRDVVDEEVDENAVTQRYTKSELERLLMEANPKRCATKRLRRAR